jgi:hypothetical protein
MCERELRQRESLFLLAEKQASHHSIPADAQAEPMQTRAPGNPVNRTPSAGPGRQ